MEAFVKFILKSSTTLTLATRRLNRNPCYCCPRTYDLRHRDKWSTRFSSSLANAQPLIPSISIQKESNKRRKLASTAESDSDPDFPDDTTVQLDGKKPTKLKRVARPMTPGLTQDQVKKFSTVLSVNIIGNRFAWCLLNRTSPADEVIPSLKLQMLELKIFNLKSKMHFLRILNEVKTLVKELPASHVCVTEEHPNQIRNQHVTNLCLEVTQARAMFIGTLASQVNSPAIVAVKSCALARIFNTFVGKEKVSGQYVAQDLIHSEENLKIDDSIRNFYQCTDSETREYLSNVFLLNLAYWIITKQYSDRFDLDKLLGNNNGNNATNKYS
jgi:hypothetical protein